MTKKRRPGPHATHVERLLAQKPVQFQARCVCGWKGDASRFYGKADTEAILHMMEPSGA